MISRLLMQKKIAVFAGFAFLAVGLFAGLFFSAFQPSSAAGQAVTVSATVTKTISCSNSTTTTSFGTLSAVAVNTSAPSVSSTMACVNDLGGCTLSINDTGNAGNGGLWSAGTSHLIPSPNAAYAATATLAAGTEGFGIQATTTAGSGAAFTVAANYNYSGNNTVGKLSPTPATLVSTTATTTGASVIVNNLAAISALTPGGSYTDTITYGCLAN